MKRYIIDVANYELKHFKFFGLHFYVFVPKCVHEKHIRLIKRPVVFEMLHDTKCIHCGGSGFLNISQDEDGLSWISKPKKL